MIFNSLIHSIMEGITVDYTREEIVIKTIKISFNYNRCVFEYTNDSQTDKKNIYCEFLWEKVIRFLNETCSEKISDRYYICNENCHDGLVDKDNFDTLETFVDCLNNHSISKISKVKRA